MWLACASLACREPLGCRIYGGSDETVANFETINSNILQSSAEETIVLVAEISVGHEISFFLAS